jgi:superfamily II DNA or RNA helicase
MNTFPNPKGDNGATNFGSAGLTDYHAKYFALDLTKQSAADSIEKLAGALADAQVDLNPHQVEAALFAFQNPFSNGAILADEVGLGKTIEAGLLLSQKWAERKRRLLVIAPANLRKQWSVELAEKFHLPAVILETKSFNATVKGGNLNPFDQRAIVLCSYQFARSRDAYVSRTEWDLVVIDEAHRLRNVYKPSNKIAQTIKTALAKRPKVLLTATPLQNSLMELYGLVSIIDDYAFGDAKSFSARFVRVRNSADSFAELKSRLAPLCKRTLRRQVLEYIKYTNRHALVQEFIPSSEEQRLYELVSEYLQTPVLHALPKSQRQLMTLILRKLLASSTFAVANTLDGLANRLRDALTRAEPVQRPPDEVVGDLEGFEEQADEWSDAEDGGLNAEADHPTLLSEAERASVDAEMAQLREFHRLATSIVSNSKGTALLTALRRGFEVAQRAQSEGGAARLQQKALIFTESRRTQDYLFRVLQETEFKGKVLLFNGVNGDELSKRIYADWLTRHKGTDKISGSPTADMRQALVDQFRNDAEIMIATEAAAEGVNLQFCNLVVNYDLPWNPQRIEQRIGRCHRYGQKFDVVVVNFLNRKNAADVRVYELLREKFQLFDGVFGASDEVLGAIESGVDFEKRIASIYQNCRTPEQIAFEFDQLQRELETEIAVGRENAQQILLSNFDQEVIERVKIDTKSVLDRFNDKLWQVTRHNLRDHADFAPTDYEFTLRSNPFEGELINPGPYRMGKDSEDVNTYRVGHPLAQRVLERAVGMPTPLRELTFYLTGSGKNIAILDSLKAKQGWLELHRVEVRSVDQEDRLVFAGVTDSGDQLDGEQCRRLFDLPAMMAGEQVSQRPDISSAIATERDAFVSEIDRRNRRWFEQRTESVEAWATDRQILLRAQVTESEQAVADKRKAAHLASTLPEQVRLQGEVRKLQAALEQAEDEFRLARKEVARERDKVLDEAASRLQQTVTGREVFAVRWCVV